MRLSTRRFQTRLSLGVAAGPARLGPPGHPHVPGHRRPHGHTPPVHLARSQSGWSLFDGDAEHIVEGSAPLACKECSRPVFLDTDLDGSLCAFCNAWTDGALVPTCQPDAKCGYCDARRASVRTRPLSRPLTDADERVAEFLREVVPIRVMDATPFRRH
jgi:hypothetical protein